MKQSNSTTRRDFLRISAAAGLNVPTILRASWSMPSFQIGLVADAQFADIDAKGTRFYRQSIGKLGATVEHFNRQDLAFCVHLGDLIDREWRSFDEVLRPLTKSRHRWHHLLGNHDFDVLDEFKLLVPGRMAMAQRYSSFARMSFRFAILDTNDVSTYAHPLGTVERAAAEGALTHYEKSKLRQAKSWNGAIGSVQLAWLDRVCRRAREAGQAVVIFAHHPVFPEGEHNVWNSAEVLTLLDRHPNVVAWINGHNHAGNYAERNGIHFLTAHGMVETANTTAFATAQFVGRGLNITGHGREPSRELTLRWPEPL